MSKTESIRSWADMISHLAKAVKLEGLALIHLEMKDEQATAQHMTAVLGPSASPVEHDNHKLVWVRHTSVLTGDVGSKAYNAWMIQWTEYCYHHQGMYFDVRQRRLH